MFFKKYKQLVTGIVIGAVVAGGGAVFADSSVQAVLSDSIHFKFNGAEKQLPDGYSVLSYQDHTYVPARFVAEQLGADVNWDDASNSVVVNGGLDYAFTHEAGQNPQQKLMDVINSAQTSLDVAIYSFTLQDVANALIDAKNRGVQVRVISDKGESNTSYQAIVLKSLQAAGIPVKIDNHTGIMHMKVTIADQTVVTTGSYNYSKAASTDNDEVIVTIHNSSLAQGWENHFLGMWNDSKRFMDYTP